MRTTYDGYEIADRDLSMRGPGDFFMDHTSASFRQSGGFSFKFAKLCDDASLFNDAFSAANEIIAADPELSAPENAGLQEIFDEKIKSDSSFVS
jgi:ATP-dependent DNA helicase RecG